MTVQAAEIVRLFVAIRVPRAIGEVIVTTAASAPRPAGPVRWVDPADLHITLWFIGPVPVTGVAALRDGLASIASAAAPFEVGIEGAGTFGRGPGAATWVGVAGAGAGRMEALAGRLHEHPFHAHVTVCRGAPKAFAEALAMRLGAAPSLAWRATALELLRSYPGRRPAYETIGRFPFGEARDRLTAVPTHC